MLQGKLTSDPSTVATSHKIMGPSSKRVSLMLFPPVNGGVTFSTETPVVYGVGIPLVAGQSPIVLQIGILGELIQRDWFAVYSGTFSPAAWIEGFG